MRGLCLSALILYALLATSAKPAQALHLEIYWGPPAYCPTTGHYYVHCGLVSDGTEPKSFADAERLAEELSYNGCSAHIVTIESEAEISDCVGGSVLGATGTCGDAASFTWVVGPSAGAAVVYFGTPPPTDPPFGCTPTQDHLSVGWDYYYHTASYSYVQDHVASDLRWEFIAEFERRGTSQNWPVLPGPPVGSPGAAPIFPFEVVPEELGTWYDPPVDSTFNYVVTDSAVFTRIADFPAGFTDGFYVHVGNVSLGRYAPGDSLVFSEFASSLGDSLIRGVGVRSFMVSNILPGVDSASPTAFPLKLAFDAPAGSFNMQGVSSPVAGVDAHGDRAQASLSLSAPQPNPFRAATRLRFTVPRAAARVELRMLDVSGRALRHFDMEGVSAGPHEVLWDGRDDQGRPVTAGVYFCRIAADGSSAQNRVILVR